MYRGMASFILAGVLCASVPASAKPTAQFLQQRMVRLKQTARTLQQAGLPSYAVKYNRTGTSVRAEDRAGAMLVTTVERGSRGGIRGLLSRNSAGTLGTWQDKVGKQSIGFMTDAGCNTRGPSSGHVRVGDEFMSYSWVRGSGYGKESITGKSGTLTEATYFVTPQEMKAFKAFYYARNKKLIKKNGTGQTIDPSWLYPGKSDLKTEACSGAASSGLNKGWVKHFGRSLAAIKTYGQQNNIPELANAPADSAQLIRKFIDRVGGKQQTDPRVLLRHHAPTADMLTIFNQNMGSNPIQSLKWNRSIQYYTSPRSGRRYRDRNNPNWNGMGYNHTVFDLAQGERAKQTWSAQRMSLSDFVGSSL